MFFGILSGKYNEFKEIFIGTSRVIFCLPIYLAILASRPDKNTFNLILVTSALITLLAALSIPYQFYQGPIEWFAESSERAGLSRFPSLFGSLTALGIVCGFGIIAAAVSFSSTIAFSLLTSAIVIGSILSLQKAAIVNILVAFLFLPFMRQLNFRFIFGIFGVFGGLMALAWIIFQEELDTYFSSLRLSSESDSDFTDDASFFDSVHERIIDLPSIAIDYHGITSLIFGIGPMGGSGAFGFPDVPMSHNGVVDLFLIGGFFYFILFFYFIFYILRLVYLARGHANDKKYYYLGLFVFFGILINIPFSGLIFFSPSNAIFFALSIKVILMCRKKII
jgi:MFS family permease